MPVRPELFIQPILFLLRELADYRLIIRIRPIPFLFAVIRRDLRRLEYIPSSGERQVTQDLSGQLVCRRVNSALELYRKRQLVLFTIEFLTTIVGIGIVLSPMVKFIKGLDSQLARRLEIFFSKNDHSLPDEKF